MNTNSSIVGSIRNGVTGPSSTVYHHLRNKSVYILYKWIPINYFTLILMQYDSAKLIAEFTGNMALSTLSHLLIATISTVDMHQMERECGKICATMKEAGILP